MYTYNHKKHHEKIASKKVMQTKKILKNEYWGRYIVPAVKNENKNFKSI